MFYVKNSDEPFVGLTQAELLGLPTGKIQPSEVQRPPLERPTAVPEKGLSEFCLKNISKISPQYFLSASHPQSEKIHEI